MVSANAKQPLLTIGEAAEYLNVSKMTVRRWTNDGRLSCLRVGPRKERRFIQNDLDDFLSDSRDDKAASPAKQNKTQEAGGVHQCLICDDSSHELAAIAKAIESHLIKKSQILFLGSVSKKDALLRTLESTLDPDSEDYFKSKAILHLTIDQSYLLSGSFSASRAVAFIESQVLNSLAAGADSFLIIGDTDWIFLGQFKDDPALIAEVWRYEEMLNGLIKKYPGVEILCPYALDKVDATTIVNSFKVHPVLRFEKEVVNGLWSDTSAGSLGSPY